MNTKSGFVLLVFCISFTVHGVLFAKDGDSLILNKGDSIAGKATDIVDGDTFLLQANKTKYNVRLFGIDAPEKDQPFGEQSKKMLAKKILGQQVQITSFGQDKTGQVLGVVKIGQRNINTEMVKEGLAWHYKDHLDSKALAEAQGEARKAKRGLWSEPSPTPPWQFHQPATAEDPFETKSTAASTRSTAKTSTAPSTEQTQSYWLTTSSNTRHNSKCRYYQKTKGRPCGPDEGKPCKVCGG